MPPTTLFDCAFLVLLSAAFLGLPLKWALLVSEPARQRRRLVVVLAVWVLPFLLVPGRGGLTWLGVFLLYFPLVRALGAHPKPREWESPGGGYRGFFTARLGDAFNRSAGCLPLLGFVLLGTLYFVLLTFVLSPCGEEFGLWDLYFFVFFVPAALLHTTGIFLIGYALPAGLILAPMYLRRNRHSILAWCWLVLSPLAAYRSSQAGMQWALTTSPVLPGTYTTSPFSISKWPDPTDPCWRLIRETGQEVDEDFIWYMRMRLEDPDGVCSVRQDRYWVYDTDDFGATWWFWIIYLGGRCVDGAQDYAAIQGGDPQGVGIPILGPIPFGD